MVYSNLQYPFDNDCTFVDSAASNNYAQKGALIEQISEVTNPSPIHLTNGSTMMASHQGLLPNLPLISDQNKTAQICPDSTNTTLISVGKLCDDDCTALLTKSQCTIYKNKPLKPILKAKRCPTTSMYVTKLSDPLLLNNANLQQFTSIERLKFLHGALGSPSLSTLSRAINAGYFKSWPDLSSSAIKRLNKPDQTIFGHLDQKQKNTQSTREKDELDDWKSTIATKVSQKTNLFYHRIVPFDNTIFTDQTGKFNVRSIRGYNYMLITYCYDANGVLVRPLQSKKGSELANTIEEIHGYLTDRGYKPSHQILDNKMSNSLRNFLKDNKVTF